MLSRFGSEDIRVSKKLWHIFVTGIVATLGLLAALTVVPSTAAEASSSPSCYGQTCDGKDPAATNCTEDNHTIYSKEAIVDGVSYGVVELRYSPSCYANWVRFAPWGGLRGLLGTVTGGEVSGKPWIWRLGVPNSLRGGINESSPAGLSAPTTWTSMVTAEGTTCWSVQIYYTESSTSGEGGRNVLGTYDAPCVP